MAVRAGALAPPLLSRPLGSLLHLRLPNPNTALSSLRPRLAVARAASGGDGGGGPPAEGGDGGGPPAEGGDGGAPPAEGNDKEQQGRPSLPDFSGIRWRDLLSPEPANAGAVVLSGALASAGAWLLLQLTLVFFSIFANAVKYSFVAATLIFVLIALL